MSEHGSDSTNDDFPQPVRGVSIICGLDLRGSKQPPVLYFGRETRASGASFPVTPERVKPQTAHALSNQIRSNNPLNSIIRKWEAKFARHGGFGDSNEFVSSSGRNDGRYYEADEWLDDGDMDGDGGNDEEYGDFIPSNFRAIDALSVDEEQVDGLESGDKPHGPSTEEGDNTDDEELGGNWQVLINRLDAYKQSYVREVVVEMEQAQAFPGNSKQKKVKSLKDCVAKLRRLLPKILHVQSLWQASIWDVVNTANPNCHTMQFFMDLWNEASVAKQREEINKEKSDLLQKLAEPAKEIVSSFKKGSSLSRSKYETFFNNIARIFELWVHEEECAGRTVQSMNAPFADSIPGRIEKRFGAHLSELVPEIDSLGVLLLRISLWGSRKSRTRTVHGSAMVESASGGLTAASDEEMTAMVSGAPKQTGGLMVSLPTTIYLYKRNELLKCRLVDITSLTSQTILVPEKEWDENASTTGEIEFHSFAELFESYQQKFVRKQDRVGLPSMYDGWKLFAVKSNEYTYLYDIASKAGLNSTYAFLDKSGNPIFLPAISAFRSADVEKQKKVRQVKEERKRKREAVQLLIKNEPPFGEKFIPFPEFSKELFKLGGTDSAASSNNTPVVDLTQ